MLEPDADRENEAEATPPDANDAPENQPVVITSPKTKRSGLRDAIGSVSFWAGFFGFFVFNALAFGIGIGLSMLTELPRVSDYPQLVSVLGMLFPIWSMIVLVANIAVLPLLAVKQRRAFWGVLTAWGALFGLVICAGLVFTVICFSAMATSNP